MKKKTPIIPERAENLKKLMIEEGLTQSALAEKVYIQQQVISRIITKKSPLTEANALAIVQAFPKYRIEWLLGYSEYPTMSDYLNSLSEKAQTEKEKMIDTVVFLASLKKIKLSLYASGFLDWSGNVQDEYFVESAVKAGYISFYDLSGIIKDLSALAESEILRTIRSKSLTEAEENENETC